MPRHPGRVERFDGVSGKGWPALAGGLPNLTTYQTGTARRAEGRAEVRPSLLLVGGEVVAIASPRTGRVEPFQHWRWCELVR